ncbi:hypothetical protein QYM36_009988 [Artemia franciscana]|uniref:Uncharacterized protein n=1 Tax=Artemia franciscana TaxID=6661 RepID=A0AA88HZD5_ARTSF|nr:hypothetical protein QYM36_009988 [Artemia franciscana]
MRHSKCRVSRNESLAHLSYAVVSDNLTHDKNAVVACTKICVDHFRAHHFHPSITHHWSNGAVSQYKNRYKIGALVHHTSDYGCPETRWSSGTARGKGPMDGIGAEVKRKVWLKTLRGLVVVNTAEQFYKALKIDGTSIMVLYLAILGLEGIHSSPESSRRSSMWKQPIFKMHKVHFATPCGQKTLHMKFHSVFSSVSSDGHFHIVYDTEPSETAVEGPSERQIANANKEKDDSETPLKAPTGGFHHKHLMAGTFITVAYEVKEKRGSMCGKVYVGLIDALRPHSAEVIFLRKAVASLYCFKFQANDRDGIEHSRVVQILPSPVINGKSFRTLNVHTSAKPGKRELVLNEMNRIDRTSDITLITSGRSDGVHRQGVGFLLSKRAKQSLLAVHPVSERIITIRLKGSIANMTIIQVYATDSSPSDQEAEKCYSQLQNTVDTAPKKDVLFVIGDFNAIVRHSNDGLEDVMGKFGHGRRTTGMKCSSTFVGITNFS